MASATPELKIAPPPGNARGVSHVTDVLILIP